MIKVVVVMNINICVSVESHYQLGDSEFYKSVRVRNK